MSDTSTPAPDEASAEEPVVEDAPVNTIASHTYNADGSIADQNFVLLKDETPADELAIASPAPQVAVEPTPEAPEAPVEPEASA